MNLFIPDGKAWPITIVLIDKSNDQVVERIETDSDLISGTLVRIGFIYNRLAYSGGSEWWNPTTGDRYFAGLKYHFELIHPETGELVTAIPSR